MTKSKTRGPSLEKTQETKKKIIDSALQHFIEVGFARAKISDIAKHAAVGRCRGACPHASLNLFGAWGHAPRL